MAADPTQTTTDLVAELRGWGEVEGMSDDARRKLWLMQRAADEIEHLRREIAAGKAHDMREMLAGRRPV